MKYLVNNHRYYESATDAAEELLECVNESVFDDEIDGLYEIVEICGINFYPSEVLKNTDPVAYRCAFSDWKDEQLDNIAEEISSMTIGTTGEYFGVTVECVA